MLIHGPCVTQAASVKARVCYGADMTPDVYAIFNVSSSRQVPPQIQSMARS